jgi:hypothetical protein
MHSLLQVVPIPGFDTVVGGISGTVYDPQMGPGSLALTIDVCEGDFDSDGDQDGTDAFVFKKDFGRGRFNRPCPYMETTTTTSMMITTTTIPSDYCPPYFTWCGSRCADTTTDENNCGSCGNVCQNGQMCVNGECEQLGSTCSGTLSPLGRWCDQGNGTVKDMSTGLIWLKDAGWGGAKYFVDTTNWDDAGTRAAILESGMAGLSDGSMWIAWRLPTLSELIGLTTGDEYIRSSSPYFFTNVQSDIYWATSTASFFMIPGWVRSGINLTDGSSYAGLGVDNNQLYVWPVRGGE